ncbi:hypothetical protein LZ32DRAFT_324738 [Colletotrichum eremochloae]|nr:hypothetical protein LZ32DRAFT_324738 [Colletotrichum eremochloae]
MMLSRLTLDVLSLSPCLVCDCRRAQGPELHAGNSRYVRDINTRRSRQKASPICRRRWTGGPCPLPTELPPVYSARLSLRRALILTQAAGRAIRLVRLAPSSCPGPPC